MRKLTRGALFVCGLIVSACGGSSSDGEDSATPEASAQSAVTSSQSLTTAADPTKQDQAIGALGRLYGDLQNIMMQKQLADAQNQGDLTALKQALDLSCVSTNAETVTYTNCNEGGATFNGTVTVVEPQVTFDISIEVDPNAYSYTVPNDSAMPGAATPTIDSIQIHETGNLNITEAAITGRVNAQIDIAMTIEIPGQGEISAPQSTAIQADYDVQLTEGCATGGTLVITSSGTTATATFGPACGDVVVE